MELTTLVEVCSACHLSHYIISPFEERGGIMLVAPPASFKSAIVMALEPYPNALVLSDLTIKQATTLREDITAHRYLSLGFPAYEKLYQRQASVASNIEGFVTGVTGEGFRKANWEDQRLQLRAAKCCVIGAMTQKFYADNFGRWIDSGFARRFIWSKFQLEDPEIIARAISKWEKIDLSGHGVDSRLPMGRIIPYTVTKEEDEELYQMMSKQPSRDVGYSLIKKILCAMKWKYPHDPKKPMAILRDFSESMGKEGALLRVTEKVVTPKKKTVKKGKR